MFGKLLKRRLKFVYDIEAFLIEAYEAERKSRLRNPLLDKGICKTKDCCIRQSKKTLALKMLASYEFPFIDFNASILAHETNIRNL